MCFEQKNEIFDKPLKLTYVTIMCNRSVIWGHDQEIWSFGKFFAAK
jgi:hypothetical protein